MIDCIVTHRIIKGKVFVVMKDRHHKEDQLLAAEFSSIPELKRVCIDAKIQYCTPKAFAIAKQWIH